MSKEMSVTASGSTGRRVDVVAVEGDVEFAEGNFDVLDVEQGRGKGSGEGDTPGLETDDHHLIEARVASTTFVGHSPDSPIDGGAVEHRVAGSKNAPYGGVRLRSRSANGDSSPCGLTGPASRTPS